MDGSNSNVKLDWMYKGINGLVNREDYLLGRSVDKTLDQLNNEEKEKKLGIVPPKNHVEHECIPPSIRDYNKIVEAEQVDLSAKLQEDPLMAIKKREEEARRKFLQNPVQLKKLQEALKTQQSKKKKKQKLADSINSDDNLDKKLIEKLQYLKSDPSAALALKKAKKNALDTILMHKFNELKDRLSQEDLNDILEGNVTDSTEEEKKKPQKMNFKNLETNSDREDSKNTKLRKRKNYQSTSSDSEEYNKKTKEERSKKKRNTKKSEANKKAYREAQSTSSEDSEDDSKEKNKIEVRRKHSEVRKTIRTKRNSSLDERHTRKSKNNERKDMASSKSDRKRNRYKKRSESDSSSCENSSTRKNRSSSDVTKETLNKKKYNRSISTDKRYKQSSSSESSSQRVKGKRKGRSANREKREKNRSRSSSDDRKHNSDQSSSMGQNMKHKVRSDDKKRIFEGSNKNDSANSRNKTESNKHKEENELDKMIMEKLKQLRGSQHDKSSSEGEESARVYAHYDSDNDVHVEKKKYFGLVRADGTKIELKRNTVKNSIESKEGPKKNLNKKPDNKNVKRLTEEEKEKIRKQMMKDAVKREKERSDNLRQYREEHKKEEMAMSYDRDFIHKELLKSTKDTSIEGRIKSKLNSIQRSSVHMNSNFSKKS